MTPALAVGYLIAGLTPLGLLWAHMFPRGFCLKSNSKVTKVDHEAAYQSTPLVDVEGSVMAEKVPGEGQQGGRAEEAFAEIQHGGKVTEDGAEGGYITLVAGERDIRITFDPRIDQKHLCIFHKWNDEKAVEKEIANEILSDEWNVEKQVCAYIYHVREQSREVLESKSSKHPPPGDYVIRWPGSHDFSSGVDIVVKFRNTEQATLLDTLHGRGGILARK